MKEDVFELDRDFYVKILARASVKKAAAMVWCSRFEPAIDEMDKILKNEEYCQIIGERDIAQLHKDKARCQIRHKSNKIKGEGDKEFYKENMDKAVAKYHEALEVDQENEYALANIGVIHLKKLEYDESIDYASKAIQIVNTF